jgi:hypothetical protein
MVLSWQRSGTPEKWLVEGGCSRLHLTAGVPVADLGLGGAGYQKRKGASRPPHGFAGYSNDVEVEAYGEQYSSE